MKKKCGSRTVKKRSTIRHARRTLARRCVRRLPGYKPGTPQLSEALSAFRRGLRSARRLAKLAPEFFDPVTVDRRTREREERGRWAASWEPLLQKVYGAAHQPPPPEDPNPPLAPAIQRAVRAELASIQASLALGHAALEEHRHRRPTDLISFAKLIRLIDTGFALGRYACGMEETGVEPVVPSLHAQWEADLHRAYGGHGDEEAGSINKE